MLPVAVPVLCCAGVRLRTGQLNFVKNQRTAIPVDESATAPKDKSAIATDKKSNKVQHAVWCGAFLVAVGPRAESWGGSWTAR